MGEKALFKIGSPSGIKGVIAAFYNISIIPSGSIGMYARAPAKRAAAPFLIKNTRRCIPTVYAPPGFLCNQIL